MHGLLVCTTSLLLVVLLPATAPTPGPGVPHLDEQPLLARSALSPERQGLRPGGGLPPALLERPDRLHDPTPRDLNATLLRAKLGRHFDPRVMSIVPPHKHRYNLLDSEQDPLLLDSNAYVPSRRGRPLPAGDMPDSIASLDFRSAPSRLSPRLKRKLQNFLWAYTACPVSRRWRDLGLRFWPRWLREGRCGAGAPCSIPPGMRCRPAATRHQALLRWHCSAKHCSWIKVEYPVITRCACGCPSPRYS